MENTKITNKVAIEYVIENFGSEMPDDILEKIKSIKASFERKSANRKPTATQIANESLKARIIDVLTANGSAMTVTEISKASADFTDLSNQKITSLVTQLKNEGRVEKIVDGKKSTFKVAE